MRQRSPVVTALPCGAAQGMGIARRLADGCGAGQFPAETAIGLVQVAALEHAAGTVLEDDVVGCHGGRWRQQLQCKGHGGKQGELHGVLSLVRESRY